MDHKSLATMFIKMIERNGGIVSVGYAQTESIYVYAMHGDKKFVVRFSDHAATDRSTADLSIDPTSGNGLIEALKGAMESIGIDLSKNIRSQQRFKNKKLFDTAREAAKWWAQRLDDAHSDRRDMFRLDLEQRIVDALDKDGEVMIENDYDPQDILLDAVHATVDAECRGWLFSGRGLFPDKHETYVTVGCIEPKEGYANWKEHIKV